MRHGVAIGTEGDQVGFGIDQVSGTYRVNGWTDNTYGYCEETGEPISLKRLEARPIAKLSVEAQERHEKREKVYRDG